MAWNKNLIFLQMQAQASGGLAPDKVLLRKRPVRVDAMTHPNRFTMDDPLQIPELKALGITEARHRENEINEQLP